MPTHGINVRNGTAYVTYGDNVRWDQGVHTVSIDVCPFTNPGAITAFVVRGTTAAEGEWQLGTTATNEYRYSMRTTVGTFTSVATTYAIRLKQWVRMTGTVDGTTARLYLRGIQAASTALAETFTATNTAIQVGQRTGGGNPCNAALANFIMLKRPLSPAEVARLGRSRNPLALFKADQVIADPLYLGSKDQVAGLGTYSGAMAAYPLPSRFRSRKRPRFDEFNAAQTPITPSVNANFFFAAA